MAYSAVTAARVWAIYDGVKDDTDAVQLRALLSAGIDLRALAALLLPNGDDRLDEVLAVINTDDDTSDDLKRRLLLALGLGIGDLIERYLPRK